MLKAGIYILAIFLHLGEGKFLSKVKNGEEFEGGLEKERKRGERRKQRKE